MTLMIALCRAVFALAARTEWFDPRTGTRALATAAGPNTYHAPSDEDRALLVLSSFL